MMQTTMFDVFQLAIFFLLFGQIPHPRLKTMLVRYAQLETPVSPPLPPPWLASPERPKAATSLGPPSQPASPPAPPQPPPPRRRSAPRWDNMRHSLYVLCFAYSGVQLNGGRLACRPATKRRPLRWRRRRPPARPPATVRTPQTRRRVRTAPPTRPPPPQPPPPPPRPSEDPPATEKWFNARSVDPLKVSLDAALHRFPTISGPNAGRGDTRRIFMSTSRCGLTERDITWRNDGCYRFVRGTCYRL